MHWIDVADSTSLHVRFSINSGDYLMYLSFRDQRFLFGRDADSEPGEAWWQHSPVFRVFASTDIDSLFLSIVNWLEALCLGVDCCGFNFDGEGPGGGLWWNGETQEVGRLTLQWSGSGDARRSDPILHTRRLRRRDVIREFYRAYRDFVDSDRYDPRDLEDLSLGDVITFRFLEPIDQVLTTLAAMGSEQAAMHIERALQGMNEPKPMKLSIADALTNIQQGDSDEWIQRDLITPEWGACSERERAERLRGALEWFVWSRSVYRYGTSKCRTYTPKSALVEEWLQKNANEDRRHG